MHVTDCPGERGGPPYISWLPQTLYQTPKHIQQKHTHCNIKLPFATLISAGQNLFSINKFPCFAEISQIKVSFWGILSIHPTSLILVGVGTLRSSSKYSYFYVKTNLTIWHFRFSLWNVFGTLYLLIFPTLNQKKRTMMQTFGHCNKMSQNHSVANIKYDHSIWTIQIGKVIYNLLSHSLLSLISTELNIWWAIDTQIFPCHILIFGPQCWCVYRFLSGFIGFSFLSLGAACKRQRLSKNPQ